MAGIQKAFLSRVRTDWQREFPFLRPVHLIEVPQLNKGTNFICDHYFPERGRAYFIQFNFSQKRFGEFSFGVTVSDSLTRSILEHGAGAPSPTALGRYAIGPFSGAQTRRWALIDHGAQADEFDRSLGLEPVGFAGMRSSNTWYPPSFAVPQEEVFDSVLQDVNSVLRQHVFPKLHIDYEKLSG
jgi:hypothetical protein